LATHTHFSLVALRVEKEKWYENEREEGYRRMKDLRGERAEEVKEE
jgi:hypothetical protein